MIALPVAIPVTIPVVAPTVAMALLLVVHVPPGDVFVNVFVAPTHTVDEMGLMAGGAAITVTGFVAAQPATVYEIVTVPVPVPVTVPVLPTVATAVLLLLHVPPAVASVKDSVVPIQISDPPGGDMAAGMALTVTTAITKQLAVL